MSRSSSLMRVRDRNRLFQVAITSIFTLAFSSGTSPLRADNVIDNEGGDALQTPPIFGVSAFATATSTDPQNYATARGDYGGNGLAGGNATAIAQTDIAAGSGIADAYAVGGPGNEGGCNGGAATASASGINSGGGSMSVYADEVGGDGGGEAIASPGNAVSIIITTPIVSGSTSGLLTLTQNAEGGRGGGSYAGSGVTPAGTATSDMINVTNPGGGSLDISNYAYGGNGGGSFDSSSVGNGATAAYTTVASISANGQQLSVSGNANGGGGGGGTSPSSNGGNGGNATGSSTATTTGTYYYGNAAISIQDSVSGGEALGGGIGGNGGTASATGTGTTKIGNIRINENAIGGDGSFGGNGGSAQATATATSSAPNVVSLTAIAIGGNGASSGLGGSASAIVNEGALAIEQYSPASGQQGGSAYVSINGGNFDDLGDIPAGANLLSLAVYNGAANLNDGTLTLSGAGSVTIGAWTESGITGINGTGSTKLSNGVTLQIIPGCIPSAQASVTVTTGAMLDITNNHMFINYGSGSDPIATIAGYIKSGYNGGSWNGVGIDSSSAAANPGYALGYADSADPGNPAGLSSGQIEVMYTLLGDANLDGIVNGDDFTIVASNLGKSVSGWDQGDFLYTGSVTGDDFTALVGNLGNASNGGSVQLPAADLAAIDAFAAANGLMADVPEPTSAGLILIACTGVLARRRRMA